MAKIDKALTKEEQLNALYEKAMEIADEYNKIAEENKVASRIGVDVSDKEEDVIDAIYSQMKKDGFDMQASEEVLEAEIAKRRESFDIENFVNKHFYGWWPSTC